MAVPGPAENKKTAFVPHGTKAIASAIPPKLTPSGVRSLLRTIIRTPVGNGWGSRRSLLGLRRSVRPQKSIQQILSCCITPPAALCDVQISLLLFLIGFLLLLYFNPFCAVCQATKSGRISDLPPDCLPSHLTLLLFQPAAQSSDSVPSWKRLFPL